MKRARDKVSVRSGCSPLRRKRRLAPSVVSQGAARSKRFACGMSESASENNDNTEETMERNVTDNISKSSEELSGDGPFTVPSEECTASIDEPSTLPNTDTSRELSPSIDDLFTIPETDTSRDFIPSIYDLLTLPETDTSRDFNPSKDDLLTIPETDTSRDFDLPIDNLFPFHNLDTAADGDANNEGESLETNEFSSPDSISDSTEPVGEVVDIVQDEPRVSREQETEVIDLESYQSNTRRRNHRADDTLVVDLTKDNICEEIVDLTASDNSFNAERSPDVMVTGIKSTFQDVTRRIANIISELSGSTSTGPRETFNDSVEEVSVEELETQARGSDKRKERKRDSSRSTTVNEAEESTSTTPQRKINCPICFDEESQIKRLKKQLTSTVCGHIFCDKCIRSAVMMQKKCPTCRKKLSLKQLHPIYL